jgi:hypothetical protein
MTLALAAFVFLAQDPPKDKGFTILEAEEVIAWISKHARVRLTFSESVIPKGKKVVISTEALDPAHALENGLKMLKSIDLAAVADGDVPGQYELVHAAIASKKVAKIYLSVADLPKVEEFCSLSLRLKNASPRGAQSMLINLASYPQNCLAEESTGAVLLSDYTSNLRRMAEVVRQLEAATPPTAFRVSVAVLEGTKGGEADVPEAWKALDLPKSTNLQKFKLVGETVARFEVPLARNPMVKSPPPSEAVLRVGGPPPVRIEFGGTARGTEGPFFERFTVLLEKVDAPLGLLVLQTRVEFRGESWILVGVAPSESQVSSLVILARAVADK